jgi:biotin carboxyl carrier protein
MGMVDDDLRVSVEGPVPLVYELSGDDVRSDDVADALDAVTPIPATGVAAGSHRYEVLVDGWRFEVTVESAKSAALRDQARRVAAEHRPASALSLRAQIPGRIVNVFVAVGDAVEVGTPLLSIEAMKMENEVRAPRAGTVSSISVATNDRVELNADLVSLE